MKTYSTGGARYGRIACRFAGTGRSIIDTIDPELLESRVSGDGDNEANGGRKGETHVRR
jgi:hypothetical protein